MSAIAPPSPARGHSSQGGYRMALTALTSLFFIWGFITSLNDILIPHLKNVFELNYTQAMLVQFCFFGAYFVVSIPAGHLVSRIGYQRGMVVGLMVAALGCALFYPAASLAQYGLFLAALFVLASGITLLQVSANPYVAALGPVETASSRLTLTQAFNALGTTVAPLFGALLILSVAHQTGALESLTAAELEQFRHTEGNVVKLPYLMIASVLVLLAVIMAKLSIPVLAHLSESDSAGNAAAGQPQDSIWQHRHLVLGALAIFIYVGAEVSIGSLMVNYITEYGMPGLTEASAAHYVAYYWGGAMVGRFIGAWVMTRMEPGRVLAFNASCSVVLVLVGALVGGKIGMVALILVGLCNSIMFPTIFSLAVSHLGALTGRGSGLVCSAIVGGALLPLLQGFLADTVGLALSFLLPAVCYLYIVFYGLEGCRVVRR